MGFCSLRGELGERSRWEELWQGLLLGRKKNLQLMCEDSLLLELRVGWLLGRRRGLRLEEDVPPVCPLVQISHCCSLPAYHVQFEMVLAPLVLVLDELLAPWLFSLGTFSSARHFWELVSSSSGRFSWVWLRVVEEALVSTSSELFDFL